MLIGQHDIQQNLQQLADSNRMPHALLFSGPEGCGKLAMALWLAGKLLNTNRLEHQDLHYVFPVFRQKGWASTRKAVSDDYIKQWHDQLRESVYFDLSQWGQRIGIEGQVFQIGVGESDEIMRKLSLVSAEGGWKIMIIWQADTMSVDAANKLLKILEEPTPQTLFILTSSHPERMLETIISRVQKIDFPPLTTPDIVQYLQENRGLDDSSAEQVAQAASGNMTEALRMLEVDNDRQKYFELFVLLMRLAYQKSVRELYQWSEQMAALSRAEQRAFLQLCLTLLRENFMYNFHRPELNFMRPDEEKFALNFAKFVNENNIILLNNEFQTALRDIMGNGNARIVFYDMSLKLIVGMQAGKQRLNNK